MGDTLITGGSGFLGKEIVAAFLGIQQKLVTLGRTTNSDIVCDLSASIPNLSTYTFSKVIHAAGKAHMVPKTEKERQDFFNVNVTGTSNLLLAIEQSKQIPDCFIFISSVSVYGLDKGVLIDETFPLNAIDAYGKSKIEAEKLIIDWCTYNKVKYYILRLPLIAGANPPGNLGAMINGIKSGKYLSIGKADAKKSIVLASDVAKLITCIKGDEGIYNLTDGCHPCFKELELKIAQKLEKKKPIAIPIFFAKTLGIIGDFIGSKFPVDTKKINKLISSLTFSDEKARKNLNWNPHKILEFWEIK